MRCRWMASVIRLDGLGYCSAHRVISSDAIEVDCLVTRSSVAQSQRRAAVDRAQRRRMAGWTIAPPGFAG